MRLILLTTAFLYTQIIVASNELPLIFFSLARVPLNHNQIILFNTPNEEQNTQDVQAAHAGVDTWVLTSDVFVYLTAMPLLYLSQTSRSLYFRIASFLRNHVHPERPLLVENTLLARSENSYETFMNENIIPVLNQAYANFHNTLIQHNRAILSEDEKDRINSDFFFGIIRAASGTWNSEEDRSDAKAAFALCTRYSLRAAGDAWDAWSKRGPMNAWDNENARRAIDVWNELDLGFIWRAQVHDKAFEFRSPATRLNIIMTAFAHVYEDFLCVHPIVKERLKGL